MLGSGFDNSFTDKLEPSLQAGLRGGAVDIKYCQAHDMVSSGGFGAALALLLSLRPGGILVMAPVCRVPSSGLLVLASLYMCACPQNATACTSEAAALYGCLSRSYMTLQMSFGSCLWSTFKSKARSI